MATGWTRGALGIVGSASDSLIGAGAGVGSGAGAGMAASTRGAHSADSTAVAEVSTDAGDFTSAVLDLNHHLGDDEDDAGAPFLSGGRIVTTVPARELMARCRAITSNRAVACLLLAILDLVTNLLSCCPRPIGSAGRT